MSQEYLQVPSDFKQEFYLYLESEDHSEVGWKTISLALVDESAHYFKNLRRDLVNRNGKSVCESV